MPILHTIFFVLSPTNSGWDFCNMEFTDEELNEATEEGLIELAKKGDPESIALIRKIQQETKLDELKKELFGI